MVSRLTINQNYNKNMSVVQYMVAYGSTNNTNLPYGNCGCGEMDQRWQVGEGRLFYLSLIGQCFRNFF